MSVSACTRPRALRQHILSEPVLYPSTEPAFLSFLSVVSATWWQAQALAQLAVRQHVPIRGTLESFGN